MPTRSYPYAVLVAGILLVVVAPFWMALDATVTEMEDTSVHNESHINASRFDGDPEANIERTTSDLWYYSRVAVVLAGGMLLLIAGRRGFG
jgi:hypothetical protein